MYIYVIVYIHIIYDSVWMSVHVYFVVPSEHNTHIYIYICIYIYTYMHIHVCICICIYIYT